MAQGDYLIQNQSFPSFRSDLNSTLEAINTSNSGTSRPSSAVAGTVWLDITNATNPTLKFFDGTDDISLAQLDYTANTVNFTDSALDVVTDTTPQLGGNLDLNSSDITGTGNINITGTVTATSFSGDGSSLTGVASDVVDDTTPQLGGDLDLNSNNITGTGNINITGNLTSTGIDDNATANALTIDSSSNLQFNSGFGSVATAYGVRAWADFDGTGTLSVNGSGNVTSVTDLGTGSYRLNYTNAMPDTNYAVIGSTWHDATGVMLFSPYIETTTTTRLRIFSTSFSIIDSPEVSVAILR